MANEERGSQRLVFQLGAALAVTALVPVSELVPTSATQVERLSALREAAQAGCLTLLCRGHGGSYTTVVRHQLAQTFDRALDESPKPP